MPDPWDDPTIQPWLDHVNDELIPMIRKSALSISLVPEKSDIKFAVELGLSIMMDKPILAVVQAGTKVPEHLIRVADEIVEMDEDFSSEASQRRLQEAITRMMAKFDIA